MNYLLVIDNATGNSCIVALAEAAALARIEPEDIAESVETFGVCQSIDYTIVDTEAADDVLAA